MLSNTRRIIRCYTTLKPSFNVKSGQQTASKDSRVFSSIRKDNEDKRTRPASLEESVYEQRDKIVQQMRGSSGESMYQGNFAIID